MTQTVAEYSMQTDAISPVAETGTKTPSPQQKLQVTQNSGAERVEDDRPVRNGSDHSTPQAQNTANEDTPPVNFRRIFVAGPTIHKASDSMLVEIFSQFGNIDRVNRVLTRNTESRRMVYIEFVEPESATKAHEFHSQTPMYICGGEIHKVEIAKPKVAAEQPSPSPMIADLGKHGVNYIPHNLVSTAALSRQFGFPLNGRAPPQSYIPSLRAPSPFLASAPYAPTLPTRFPCAPRVPLQGPRNQSNITTQRIQTTPQFRDLDELCAPCFPSYLPPSSTPYIQNGGACIPSRVTPPQLSVHNPYGAHGFTGVVIGAPTQCAPAPGSFPVAPFVENPYADPSVPAVVCPCQLKTTSMATQWYIPYYYPVQAPSGINPTPAELYPECPECQKMTAAQLDNRY